MIVFMLKCCSKKVHSGHVDETGLLKIHWDYVTFTVEVWYADNVLLGKYTYMIKEPWWLAILALIQPLLKYIIAFADQCLLKLLKKQVWFHWKM